jgi:hypothetical protein
VRQERFVRSPRVPEVLMDIDDGLRGGARCGSPFERQANQPEAGARDERTARNTGGMSPRSRFFQTILRF